MLWAKSGQAGAKEATNEGGSNVSRSDAYGNFVGSFNGRFLKPRVVDKVPGRGTCSLQLRL